MGYSLPYPIGLVQLVERERVFRWISELLRTFADFSGPGTNKDHKLVVTKYEILRLVSTASIVNGGRYFIFRVLLILKYEQTYYM